MRIWRDFTLLALALMFAYGGGYYFGRHPESLRELVSSKSLVIATTEDRILNREVQNWLEDRWGHSIIVLLISETEIESRLADSDLILAPLTTLKPYETQLKPRPENLPLEWVDPDFLIQGDQTIPLLWKLVKVDERRQKLVKLALAWTPKSEDHPELVRWLLSRNAQSLMSKDSSYYPVRLDLLQDPQSEYPRLRAIPLSDLIWE
ncbi:MAG: hypothetical protein KF767_17205 [Bdellovibrionaceae bacterium]|nr:hypothetical protein [Pseudobdellovibrionaceae bacterium]